MRAEELVGRTDQEVAAQILNICCDMRRRLHRINVTPGADITRLRANAFYIIDCAGQVTCPANADQSGTLAQDFVEDAQIEFEAVRIERQPPNFEIVITSQ